MVPILGRNSFFKADPTSNKPPYCIVIPPPNVTGVLHMGHALVGTLQDILIRWKRMLGFEVFGSLEPTMPASPRKLLSNAISSKAMAKNGKIFTREEFLKHVWEWKEESEARILNQLKKLGCSCDWSRTPLHHG